MIQISFLAARRAVDPLTKLASQTDDTTMLRPTTAANYGPPLATVGVLAWEVDMVPRYPSRSEV